MKYYQRAVLQKGEQKKLLQNLIRDLKLSNNRLAQFLGVSVRTITDWKREKYFIQLPAFKKLSKMTLSPIPKNIEIRDPFWYTSHGSSAGAMAVLKKYGYIGGDPEYRKKKWLEWWEKIGKFNKNRYFVTKKIRIPKQDKELAEFIGIVLGDGSITKRQIIITLNRKDDKEYVHYVSGLTKKIFGIVPSFYIQGSVCDLSISRTELVKFLIKNGLSVGNKVKHQITVPGWIQRNSMLSKYCVRGLIDTDGSFYIEKHSYKNKIYHNCVINFTNHSFPLLKFVKTILQKIGLNAKKRNRYNICLGKEEEVSYYFKEIGSSNPKHYNKYRRFMEEKYGGVPKWS